MVEYYPGPWQDGPLTTEVHDIGAGTITRTTADADVALPVASGWSVAGWKSWTAGASASESIPGGLSDEPEVTPAVSEAAWGEAYDVPTTDAVGGVAAAQISHPPMQLSNNLGAWSHSERWDLAGGYWKLRYQRPSNNLQAGVAPPFEEWPEGAVAIGFDYPPPGNISQYWIDLVDARVHGTGNPTWPLYLKAAGVTGNWFGDGNDPEDIGDNATLGASLAWPISDPVEIPVETLDAFVVENVEAGEVSQHDPRWLSGSVAHNPGLFPGAFGATDFTDTYQPPDHMGHIVLRYRPPRWRYIYDRPIIETVPFRRTYPRHDSLAGGAGRNYPPSKALQTSNRVGGAYL